ncbi:MAG: hypothetical protein IPG32_13545 [Saprospirales bacterium]|nr:hypothetical protein [Saprospirales bacterium]
MCKTSPYSAGTNTTTFDFVVTPEQQRPVPDRISPKPAARRPHPLNSGITGVQNAAPGYEDDSEALSHALSGLFDSVDFSAIAI